MCGGVKSDKLGSCKLVKETVMKVVLFADDQELKADDYVICQTVQERKLFAENLDLTKQNIREEFKRRYIPLYEVVSVTKRSFLWYKRHFVTFRRISDSKVFRINLDPPASGIFDVRAPVDIRLNWAKLEF